jgi:signal transduction histidine kinase
VIRALRPGSLSFRLLAGALLWIALALAASDVLLTRIFRDRVEEQFTLRVEATLDRLAADLEAGSDGGLTLTARPADPDFRKPYSGLYWQVSAAGGAVRLRSRSLWDAALDLPADTLLDGELHRHRLDGPAGQTVIAYERAVTLPGRAGRLRLVVAEDASALAAAVADFRRALTWSLTVLGVGLLAAALLQVLGGLRPLQRLRRALARVRAGRAQRLEGRYPDEIAPVVHDLNAVLAQNEEVVARARTQAGNLAHGLKTPIAVLHNEADRLAAEGRDADARTLREQLDLMQRQVDAHLARARAAAASRVPGTRTALAPVLARLLRTMRTVHAERGLRLTAEATGDLAVRSERQDLEEILGNLLDNACKWAEHQVQVGAAADGTKAVRLHVDDDGPGLPAELRARALERGRRLDERRDGSGLGLTIVAELAELYGGRVDLADSPLGGLRVTVTLPAA